MPTYFLCSYRACFRQKVENRAPSHGIGVRPEKLCATTNWIWLSRPTSKSAQARKPARPRMCQPDKPDPVTPGYAFRSFRHGSPPNHPLVGPPLVSPSWLKTNTEFPWHLHYYYWLNLKWNQVNFISLINLVWPIRVGITQVNVILLYSLISKAWSFSFCNFGRICDNPRFWNLTGS